MRYNISGETLKNYDCVVGKALLEYRTGVNELCSQIDSLGLCNIMDCLYCNNCYYKITLENGEAIANTDVDLKSLDNKRRGFEDVDHEILFYDYVPDIDDLFGYLFDDNSQFKIVRKNDNMVMVDKKKPEKRIVRVYSKLDY